LKVLLVHNRYRQLGGEDGVFFAERELLAGAGHHVIEYTRHSDEIVLNGLAGRARLGVETVWSRKAYGELRALLAHEKPDVAHFHNLVPLISPSALHACRDAGIPTVRTLHNYQLFCPAGIFYRAGHVCEECVDHSLLRSVRYGCYRQDRAATTAVASMLAFHRWRGTWDETVDLYIALTEFSRRKFLAAGLAPERIAVKPNFVAPDPGEKTTPGEYALFAGRLVPEKGVGTLLAAWERLGAPVPLRIIGEGALRSMVEAASLRPSKSLVRFAGGLLRPDVQAAMKRAHFLVFPSEWYECFPLVIVEAFACGLPVIASRMGAMEEIVEDGRTGLHFTPGDAEDLAAKAEWAWAHPSEMEEMGRAARAEYEAKYTAARNYRTLMRIYEQALSSRRAEADTCITPKSGCSSA
jgi:glycosyltransferase involved in cell wall biosynthesis